VVGLCLSVIVLYYLKFTSVRVFGS
jgi:hypothetical protein